jgi:RND family efflux transporter MFP subunit
MQSSPKLIFSKQPGNSKTYYMQQKIMKHTITIAALFLLAACGSSEKQKNGSLADKKAELQKLKEQVTKLENEIAKTDTAAGKAEKAKLVTLQPVTPEVFTHFIDLQGKIESENVSYVTPRGGPGQVKALYLKRGDYVKKGQLLLKLDDAIARQSVIAAEQGLENIKTQLAYAENLYQKQKNLWYQNIGTELQLITAKNNVQTAENQLKTAQEQLKITKEQLQFTNVTSDVEGVADEVNIKVGETFTGVNQVKMVNTNHLKATAQIPENYLARVKVGCHVKITMPDINRTIDATVSVAGKLIDPNSRSFFVEARIPSAKDLRPNQLALVKIQDYNVNNAITVPVNTLQNDDKGKFVMVAIKENGKLIARKKPVTIGEMYRDKLEIKSGLQPGDSIITDGYQSLYEGQLITTEVK